MNPNATGKKRNDAVLTDIRSSLERLVGEYAQISPDEVDVRHDPPTREWIERLTRPTISFFLFDIQENTDLRAPGMHTFRGASDAVKRFAPRRIDLHFMVSALTSEVGDEDTLLWRLLWTLLKYTEWPEELTPEAVRDVDLPVAARLDHGQDAAHLADIWSGLSARPRPALAYVVTVPLDLEVAVTVPLVLTRVARTLDMDSGREMKRSVAITGTVRTAAGIPLAGAIVAVDGRLAGTVETAQDGRFILTNLAEGPLRLTVTAPDGRSQPVSMQIPANSYDIQLD
jgi:hypothetical protein